MLQYLTFFFNLQAGGVTDPQPISLNIESHCCVDITLDSLATELLTRAVPCIQWPNLADVSLFTQHM